jgi:hypothetical protein
MPQAYLTTQILSAISTKQTRNTSQTQRLFRINFEALLEKTTSLYTRVVLDEQYKPSLEFLLQNFNAACCIAVEKNQVTVLKDLGSIAETYNRTDSVELFQNPTYLIQTAVEFGSAETLEYLCTSYVTSRNRARVSTALNHFQCFPHHEKASALQRGKTINFLLFSETALTLRCWRPDQLTAQQYQDVLETVPAGLQKLNRLNYEIQEILKSFDSHSPQINCILSPSRTQQLAYELQKLEETGRIESSTNAQTFRR